jgi:hypothetical protein
LHCDQTSATQDFPDLIARPLKDDFEVHQPSNEEPAFIGGHLTRPDFMSKPTMNEEISFFLEPTKIPQIGI